LLIQAQPAQSFLAKRDGTPFDGQYIHPNSSNDAVEWWWGQAIADPQSDDPPAAFQFLFYQGFCGMCHWISPSILTKFLPKGYPFGPRDPSLPEFYITINGFFPNGSQFASTLPATSGNVATSGQEVTGTWAGAGGFKGSADLSTFTVMINAPSAGFEGTVKFKSNAAPHFGCNSTTEPYFSSAIPSGTKLSDAESLLYTQLGWATTIPGTY
jgi:hypothetical protein